jgi:hypothetical protein
MANSVQPESAIAEPRSRSKRIAKWGSGLLAAFLAFAPPGTLIVTALLIWQFVGGNWLLIAGILVLAVGATVFLVVRRGTPGD